MIARVRDQGVNLAAQELAESLDPYKRSAAVRDLLSWTASPCDQTLNIHKNYVLRQFMLKDILIVSTTQTAYQQIKKACQNAFGNSR